MLRSGLDWAVRSEYRPNEERRVPLIEVMVSDVTRGGWPLPEDLISVVTERK